MNQKGILTQDGRMLELIELAKTVAQSKATVLIEGESGTGKEEFSKFIHEQSARSSKYFSAINCAAIPENLLESELFGYEKGAFTGAVTSKAGLFEVAHGGTLLLDEVSDMDIRLQAKLLRVLQEGEVFRLGRNRPITINVRVIATTNRNLGSLVLKGKFREDLYYRLNVVNLVIPPLRDRLGDVEILTHHFIQKYSKENNKDIHGISKEALTYLLGHPWMGNIRELENAVQRAVITCQESIVEQKHFSGLSHSFLNKRIKSSYEDLEEESEEKDEGWKPGETLNDIERKVIIHALRHHRGNRTHTAHSLGISIRTLRNKLAEYRKMGIFL